MRLLPHAQAGGPESPTRPHFVKVRVNVDVYPGGSHAVLRGPRRIGRHDEKEGSRRATTPGCGG